MLYTLVFTILIVTLYISTATKLVIRPDCSALYTSVYNFNCNLVFSTAIQLVIRPDCNALYTSVYKFDCNLVFSTAIQACS